MLKNGEDWGKLIVAKGFKKLPKVQNIAQSGHTTLRPHPILIFEAMISVVFPSGSLTRNSSVDLKEFKTRSEKKKIYDAISAASIFHNVAGEATSRYSHMRFCATILINAVFIYGFDQCVFQQFASSIQY